jgi:hypothetical protein
LPATSRHKTWVSAGQLPTATPIMNARPSAAASTALAIALSHAASPGRTLVPPLVSGASSTGPLHAATAA